jgi:hypothetical protein
MRFAWSSVISYSLGVMLCADDSLLRSCPTNSLGSRVKERVLDIARSLPSEPYVQLSLYTAQATPWNSVSPILNNPTNCPDGYVCKPQPAPHFSRQLSFISPAFKSSPVPRLHPFELSICSIRCVMISACLSADAALPLLVEHSKADICLNTGRAGDLEPFPTPPNDFESRG